MLIPRRSKRGSIIGGGLLLFLETIIIIVILILFIAASGLIKSYVDVPVGVTPEQPLSIYRDYFFSFHQEYATTTIDIDLPEASTGDDGGGGEP